MHRQRRRRRRRRLLLAPAPLRLEKCALGLRAMVEVSHLARREAARSILERRVWGSSFVVNQDGRRISPSPPAISLLGSSLFFNEPLSERLSRRRGRAH